MDKKGYDETVKRLRAVNQEVSKLDPAIRGEAWDLLKPYVIGAPVPSHGDGGTGARAPAKQPRDLDVRTLLDEHASDDGPIENGLLVAAILYGTYGDGPFEPKEFKAVGDEHRLLMPIMHNFLPRTKRDEKKIFRKTRGGWVITLDGAKWLTATYGVKRGTTTKSD
jgi:hypothetical protein